MSLSDDQRDRSIAKTTVLKLKNTGNQSWVQIACLQFVYINITGTDALLYDILPKSVAEVLKSGREVVPTDHQRATICYVDMLNFVSTVSQMTPNQALKLLNSLYV